MKNSIIHGGKKSYYTTVLAFMTHNSPAHLITVFNMINSQPPSPWSRKRNKPCMDDFVPNYLDYLGELKELECELLLIYFTEVPDSKSVWKCVQILFILIRVKSLYCELLSFAMLLDNFFE